MGAALALKQTDHEPCPLALIVGGIAGFLGGIFGKRRASAEAKEALAVNRASINDFIALGMGQGVGQNRSTYTQFRDQGEEFKLMAERAKDNALKSQIEAARLNLRGDLKLDFERSFKGTIDALNDGLGSGSPFAQGKRAVEEMRDELKNFVADTKWMAGELGSAAVSTTKAEKAARAYALSMLTGARELSPMEAAMARLNGISATLQNTLEDLGLSEKAAADAIAKASGKAVGGLRGDYRDTLARSINELSGNGYRNEAADAADVFRQRRKDINALFPEEAKSAREIEMSADALREFTLSIRNIGSASEMSRKEFDALAKKAKLDPASNQSLWNEILAARKTGTGGGPAAPVFDNATAIADLELRRKRAAYDTRLLQGALDMFDAEMNLEKARLRAAGASVDTIAKFDEMRAAEKKALDDRFKEQDRAMKDELGLQLKRAQANEESVDSMQALYNAERALERARLLAAGATDKYLKTTFDVITGIGLADIKAEIDAAQKDRDRARANNLDDLAQRHLRASTDGSTQAGALKLFDAAAALEVKRAREAAWSAGEITKLEAALAAERTAIVDDFKRQEASRYGDLSLNLLRLSTDTTTLNGALKVLDAERKKEIDAAKAAGESARNVSLMEQALAKERQQIINDFNRRAIDESKAAVDEALGSFRAFALSISDFKRQLKLDAGFSTLNPLERLNEAASQFSDISARAMAGDRDAMERLTGVSQVYLDEAKRYYSSTSGYADIYTNVMSVLDQAEAWASTQVSDAEKQIDLLSKQVSGIDTVNTSVLSVADAVAKLTGAVTAYLGAGGSYSGFSAGGWTGPGGVDQVAGVVHGQEFVAHAAATARWRPQLEAMNRGAVPALPAAGGLDRETGREIAKSERASSHGIIRAVDTLRAELSAELRRMVDAQQRGNNEQAKIMRRG